MRTKVETWGEVCGERVLQARQSGSPPLHEHGTEACERGPRWETLIGRIVSFTVDPSTVKGCLPTAEHQRHAGSVLRVEAAPDFRGLPTCLALIVGRSGKKVTINYTEHYGQAHATWVEADKYNGNKNT